MMKHRWIDGAPSYETRPSNENWLKWFGVFTTWFLFTSYLMSAHVSFQLATSVALTFSPWFLFRSGKWGLTSYFAWSYLKRDFPKLKSRLEALSPGFRLAVVYTAWGKSPVEIETAFRRTVISTMNSQAGTVFFYAAVSKGRKGQTEINQLKRILHDMVDQAIDPAQREFFQNTLRLITVEQEGEGKRHYLVRAVRRIMHLGGADYYYLVDGDSFPQESLIAEGVRYLQTYADVGGLTFNNLAYVQGTDFFLFYTMFRFIRRMTDLAFAPTVLTGRGSLVRGIILEDEEALAYMEAHPFKTYDGFVMGFTGDDKTTVYLTWAKGFKTLFIPDLFVYAFEEAIKPRKARNGYVLEAFLGKIGLGDFVSIVRQEFRYGGNNLRALYDLWPNRPKDDFAITLKLWDQKYFWWSGIFGFMAMLVASSEYGYGVLFLYLWWTFVIRTIITVLPGIAFGYWHPALPFMSYLNILQTLVKIVSRFNLDVAAWPREGTSETQRLNVWMPSLFILSLYMFLKIVILS